MGFLLIGEGRNVCLHNSSIRTHNGSSRNRNETVGVHSFYCVQKTFNQRYMANPLGPPEFCRLLLILHGAFNLELEPADQSDVC